MAQRIPRLIRAADFVTESLEEMASRLPPSEKAQAEYLRGTAKAFRESGRTTMLGIREKAKGEVDFIRPDPASQG